MPKPLTPRERLVVQLHYVDGWKLSAIAEGIGVTRQCVRCSHAAALTKLRALGPAGLALIARE